MTDAEFRKIVAKALKDYRKSGARELPSVKKSVPRPFRDAVDALTDALESALSDA